MGLFKVLYVDLGGRLVDCLGVFDKIFCHWCQFQLEQNFVRSHDISETLMSIPKFTLK